MTERTSLPAGYFDALYAADPDPWRFASSEYERSKYAATLAALPRARFEAGLEVGCSIGVLTRQLMARCDALLAVDASELALRQARERCAGLQGLRFARMQVPEEWPSGSFDLMLFSEVLYYLDHPDLMRVAQNARAGMRAGGAVLLVHYVLATDYPNSGDGASEAFIAASGMRVSLRQRAQAYRLDLLEA